MNTEYEKVTIAGTGAIATGVAATASTVSSVVVLARSDASIERSRALAEKFCAKLEGGDPTRISYTTDRAETAGSNLIVEAIVEDLDAKVELHRNLAALSPDADIATTTSSLSVAAIAAGAGIGERFFGLHVFNPVTRMDLIELCLPEALEGSVGERARNFCAAIGKTAVEVPDIAGFVVNRLLFAYLFDAVRLLEESGLEPAAVDQCMKRGAGHPMGPLALLDFVGFDVSIAIGQSLFAATGEARHDPPARLCELAADGKLGRKSGAGFFDYS